jgi:hypothetical protein
MYPGVLNPRVERFGGPRRGLAAFDVPGSLRRRPFCGRGDASSA